ncbi:MAG TPA: serine hydrolase [Bacteroidales bacterium]|nr:serine hydrolase [Bacteroidales bacterium]
MIKAWIYPHKKKIFFAIIICVAVIAVFAFFFKKKNINTPELQNTSVAFLSQKSAWADSLMACMSVEEKAGQLLMTCINTNQKKEILIEEVKAVKPGGIYIAAGSARRLGQTTRLLGENTRVPILFAVNAPCGFCSPDDSLSTCATMPGIDLLNDTNLIKTLSEHITMQMKHYGIHINMLLPLQAITANQDIPYDRSSISFISGLQKKLLKQNRLFREAGILACAHGFNNSEENTPAFDLPAFDSLRKKVLSGLACSGLQSVLVNCNGTKTCDSLVNTYKYQGLILSCFSQPLQDESAAYTILNSGCDMLVLNEGKKELATKIIQGIANGKIAGDVLDKKVKRILMIKSWVLQNNMLATNADSADFVCTSARSKQLYHRVVEASAVLLNNRENIVPLRRYEKEKIAVLQIGNKSDNEFFNALKNYSTSATGRRYTNPDEALKDAGPWLSSATLILLNVFESPDLYAHAEKFRLLIEKLSRKKKLVLTVIGSTRFLGIFDRAPCMLWSPCIVPCAGQNLCSVIFGGETVKGTMPYSCSQEFCYKDGIAVDQAIRFKYTSPEDAGVNGSRLYKIDSIINFAIGNGAFPGCQVFFARNGKVFYNKSFGTHTYDKKEKVKNTDLYDVASVTKVAATTLALMALYDKGKIKLDTTLNYYFDDLDKNACGQKVRFSKLNFVTLRALLTHKSGLPEGLPIGLFISPKSALKIMKKQMENMTGTTPESITSTANGEYDYVTGIDTALLDAEEDSLLRYVFSKNRSPDYKLEIAKNLFLRNVIQDSLWQLAKQMWMSQNKDYLYSDLNFYLVMKVVEKVAKTQLDKYLDQSFFALLNLNRIGFHPLEKYEKKEIVPTEDEKYFRKQLIHGYVHDPMAALLGGVGGNAGLFSDAHDLGVLMQLLLNKGTYGGVRYFSEKTVALFTTAQGGTYRGLGFDRKGKADAKMVAPGASLSTYGHTGFTGTCVWADPENDLVYVFLSNRVYPKISNQKINTYRIRQNIQQTVYDAFLH